jgi:hypothetical protein
MSATSYRYSISCFDFDENNTYQRINNAFKLVNGLKSNEDTYVGNNYTIKLEDFTATIYFHTSYCPTLDWKKIKGAVQKMCNALYFDYNCFEYEVYDFVSNTYISSDN